MTQGIPGGLQQRSSDWLIAVTANSLALGGAVYQARRLPTQLALNQVLAWALLAAGLGSLLWLAVFRVGKGRGFFKHGDEPTGGTTTEGGSARSAEPSGMESVAWVLSNLAGPILVAWWVNTRLPDRPAYPVSAYLACIVGCAVGAAIFYGLRLRNFVLRKVYGYESQEFLLVLLWSALLTGAGFAGFDLVSTWSSVPGLPSSLLSWSVRTLTCTVITTCVVTCYVLFDPRRTAATEAVRGVIAALTLILTLFFATIATSFTEALEIFV